MSKAACFLAVSPRCGNHVCVVRPFHGGRTGCLAAGLAGGDSKKTSRKEEATSSDGHYFLSMLRQSNPDPAMARLPPLPPNDAIRFTDGPGPVIDLSPSTGPSDSAVAWLRLLNQGEDWAQGKGPNPLFDPKPAPTSEPQ